MLSQVEAARSLAGFAPRSARLRETVWAWFRVRWHLVSAGISVAMAVLLLASGALPPLLTPFVLGPLGAVVVTVLIAPRDDQPASGRPSAPGGPTKP